MSCSKHTQIMNILIGFTKDISEFPSYLKNVGYGIGILEPVFRNSENKKVNPDILIHSNKSLNVLISECTKGTIEEEDVKKYNNIDEDDLRKLIEKESLVYDSSKITCQLFFAGTKKTKQSYEVEDEIIEVPNPGFIFCFDEGKVRRIKDFEDSEINKEIDEEDFPVSNIPKYLYPFSPDDDAEYITSFIVQQLPDMVVEDSNKKSKFKTDEVLKKIFRKRWELLSPTGKKSLRRKVSNILIKLEDKGLIENIEKMNGEEIWYVQSCKALRRKIKEAQKELENEETTQDIISQESNSQEEEKEESAEEDQEYS